MKKFYKLILKTKMINLRSISIIIRLYLNFLGIPQKMKCFQNLKRNSYKQNYNENNLKNIKVKLY